MSKRYAETENPQYHRTYNELTRVSQIFLLPKMVDLSSVSEKSIQGILQELESKAERCSNLLQSVIKEIEKTPDNPELIRQKLQQEARQDVLSAEIEFAHELKFKKAREDKNMESMEQPRKAEGDSPRRTWQSYDEYAKAFHKDALAAMALLSEKQESFTLPEVVALVAPNVSGITHKSPEYSRVYREAKILSEKGVLVRRQGRKGAPFVYSLVPGASILDAPKKDTPEPASPPASPPEAANMIEDPDFCLAEAAGEDNPLRPILLEDVLSNLEIICRERNSAVGSDDLRQRFYPANNDGKVSSILKYLVDTGKILRTKVKQKYFYHPHWLTVNPIQPEPEPTPPAKGVPKKVLAFQCEVCAALIGIKALDSLQIINCNGCQSKYLIDRRNAFRMNPAINLEVWSPIPNQIL